MSGKTLGQIGYEALQAARWPAVNRTAWTHPAVADSRPAWETAMQAVAAHAASTSAETIAARREAYVVRYFAETWDELITSLPDSYDCHMTCAEANAAADLYRALGLDDTAQAIIAAHAEHDDEEEIKAHHRDDGDPCTRIDEPFGAAAEPQPAPDFRALIRDNLIPEPALDAEPQPAPELTPVEAVRLAVAEDWQPLVDKARDEADQLRELLDQTTRAVLTKRWALTDSEKRIIAGFRHQAGLPDTAGTAHLPAGLPEGGRL